MPVKFSVSQRVTGLFGGWLSVTPENGSIPPRSTTELDVEFDATDLYQGRYMGSIIVTTEAQQVENNSHVPFLEIKTCADLPHRHLGR